MKNFSGISRQIIQRLPMYVSYLCTLPPEQEYVSASAIASSLHLNDVQVRKDLAAVSSWGRPKVGYPVVALRRD